MNSHTGRTTPYVSTFRSFRPSDSVSRPERFTFDAKIILVSFSVFRQCVRSTDSVTCDLESARFTPKKPPLIAWATTILQSLVAE
jgi:hypothetical protein